LNAETIRVYLNIDFKPSIGLFYQMGSNNIISIRCK
jgi:hypothetical protein